MNISNCCGEEDGMTSHNGPSWSDIGICPQCKEHCEFIDEEEKDIVRLDLLVKKLIVKKTVAELAIGYLRYEALRKLNPRQYSELDQRNLNGENFDGMVDELVRG